MANGQSINTIEEHNIAGLVHAAVTNDLGRDNPEKVRRVVNTIVEEVLAGQGNAAETVASAFTKANIKPPKDGQIEKQAAALKIRAEVSANAESAQNDATKEFYANQEGVVYESPTLTTQEFSQFPSPTETLTTWDPSTFEPHQAIVDIPYASPQQFEPIPTYLPPTQMQYEPPQQDAPRQSNPLADFASGQLQNKLPELLGKGGGPFGNMGKLLGNAGKAGKIAKTGAEAAKIAKLAKITSLFAASAEAVPVALIVIGIFVGILIFMTLLGGPLSPSVSIIPVGNKGMGGTGTGAPTCTPGEPDCAIAFCDPAKSDCSWPTPTGCITVGPRNGDPGSTHNTMNAVDIGFPGATHVDVRATHDGIITEVEDSFIDGQKADESYGNHVILSGVDANGTPYSTMYAHLWIIAEYQKSGRTLQKGDNLTKGDPIGKTDDNGTSFGEHLHYEYIGGGNIEDTILPTNPIKVPQCTYGACPNICW